MGSKRLSSIFTSGPVVHVLAQEEAQGLQDLEAAGARLLRLLDRVGLRSAEVTILEGCGVRGLGETSRSGPGANLEPADGSPPVRRPCRRSGSPSSRTFLRSMTGDQRPSGVARNFISSPRDAAVRHRGPRGACACRSTGSASAGPCAPRRAACSSAGSPSVRGARPARRASARARAWLCACRAPAASQACATRRPALDSHCRRLHPLCFIGTSAGETTGNAGA